MKSAKKHFNVPEDEAIEVNVREGEVRVCNYCNTVLIDTQGGAIKTAYLTDFGLICGDCIGDVESLNIYPEGKNVIDEDWYQDGIDRDCF